MLKLFDWRTLPVCERYSGEYARVRYSDLMALEAELQKYKAELQKYKAELQKYKDQFPDYVECVNCGSVTHVEGVE